MAKVIGQRKRGRRKEALRIAVAELAASVTAAKGTREVTVEVAPAKTPKGKPEVVTYEIPKGAALVPLEMTRDKKDANAREQIRLGAQDAEASVSIRSTAVQLDDGETTLAIFHLEPKG